jgi:hypothetical protein
MMGVRLVLAMVAMAGCTRTFEKEAVQPNPLAHPTETLRTSEPITIVTGDMELEQPDPASGYYSSSPIHNHHYPLFNSASFTVVSRDRLRFHVQIDHKWEDWADPRTWEVYLLDDKGHKWTPESVEHAHTHLITKMWDREQQVSICDARGRDANGDCITTIGTDEASGWQRRMTLGSLSVFRGKADFVFYQRDIFTTDVRWLKLVVRRTGEAFEFTWRFQDTVAAE